jgi:acetoin utilization protein AcuB
MQRQLLVQGLMSGPPVTIPLKARLVDAALLMRRSSVRHLLVVEGGRLVGLLTDRDLQRCAPSRLIPITEEAYNDMFANTPVERVMVRDPRTIPVSAPVIEAITTMQQAQIGCLPVMDGEKIVGIVTRWDLIEAFRRMLVEQTEGKTKSGSR